MTLNATTPIQEEEKENRFSFGSHEERKGIKIKLGSPSPIEDKVGSQQHMHAELVPLANVAAAGDFERQPSQPRPGHQNRHGRRVPVPGKKADVTSCRRSRPTWGGGAHASLEGNLSMIS